MKKQVNLGIIGCGLMGCSMALDLKNSGFAKQVFGFDNNSNNLKTAVNLKYVVPCKSIDLVCVNSDLVVVATPVTFIPEIVDYILTAYPGVIVTDLGSTKSKTFEQIYYNKNKEFYVFSHPMAGSEKSGASNAFSGMFRNKQVIMYKQAFTNNEAHKRVLEMYSVLKMNTVNLNPGEHDYYCGLISHLPHLVSFALASTIFSANEKKETIKTLSSGGFESMMRLSGSDADMWTAIFVDNKINMLKLIESFSEKINKIKQHIENEEVIELKNFINTTKQNKL